MKYKLLGGVMAALILVCALAASALEAEEGPIRIHQHLSARDPDAGCSCDGAELCTHLPLVIIDTGGQELPGAPNGEEDYYGEELYTTAEDGTDFINVQVTVIDNQAGNNIPLIHRILQQPVNSEFAVMPPGILRKVPTCSSSLMKMGRTILSPLWGWAHIMSGC